MAVDRPARLSVPRAVLGRDHALEDLGGRSQAIDDLHKLAAGILAAARFLGCR